MPFKHAHEQHVEQIKHIRYPTLQSYWAQAQKALSRSGEQNKSHQRDHCDEVSNICRHLKCWIATNRREVAGTCKRVPFATSLPPYFSVICHQQESYYQHAIEEPLLVF